jgi:hypothetical protein
MTNPQRITPVLVCEGQLSQWPMPLVLREISPFLPDAIAQSADDRLDAALKVLAEMLKE